MKNLIINWGLAFSALLATNAYSGLLQEEIEMRCVTDVGPAVYKLTLPRFGNGEENVQVYFKGKWEHFCSSGGKFTLEEYRAVCRMDTGSTRMIRGKERTFITKEITDVYADFKTLEFGYQEFLQNSDGEFVDAETYLESVGAESYYPDGNTICEKI